MADKRKKGNRAEELVCEFLKEKGFRILERNFYTRWGEIDIIALKDKTLHFIEVRSGSGFIDPIESITTGKIKHLTKAIQIYLKKSGWRHNFRAHLAAVYFTTPPRIELIEDFIDSTDL